MSRATWSVMALFAVLALAGCTDADEPQGNPVQPDPDPEPEPPAGNDTIEPPVEPEPLGPVQFSATNCNAVVPLSIDDYSNIDHFLPAAFIPADVASLLRIQDVVFLSQGAIGPIIALCEDNSITNQELGFVLPGTLVYSPEIASDMAGSFADGYEDFIGFTDDNVSDLFQTYGWDVLRGVTMELEMYVDVNPFDTVPERRIPGAAASQATVYVDDVQAINAYAFGTAHYSTGNEELPVGRFWHDTPEGLSFIEVTVSEHGRSGLASCEYAAGSRFAETFERETCTNGETVGLIIPGFDLETTLVRLDGIHG